VPVIKTLSILPTDTIESVLSKYQRYSSCCEFILLDTGSTSQAGGTGSTFNWEQIAKPLSEQHQLPFILAGGLNMNNYREALFSGPWCLDFNSGLESSPGIKEEEKLKQFFQNL
jgi:phosphoribosylanthranilate isomerase